MKIQSRPDSATFRRVFSNSQAYAMRLTCNRFDRAEGIELLQKIESWVSINAMVNSQQMPLLTLDMQEVDFLDSNGLAALLEARRILRSHGSNLSLCSLQVSVKLILEISKSDRAFAIFDSFDGFVAYVEANQEVEVMAA
ncbi:STAS domain-containing protein [Tumidithrix elongata RA019]|uniref:STAS domain-containing protein n=1 Tax=Tumidithrix elongata BACA0141 TaxID=2716417 RepID=A0AAW9PRL8_9CYAN|nr:STAS domain-containing protein [Tumidithrix elongata RA019]